MSASVAPPLEQRVCLASAGAGKTWSLSERFIQVLAAGADPAAVLATTFTRKASGEILERVLARLVRGCRGEDAPAGLEAAACQRLLARLAHSLDRFQVRTLDSFFCDLLRLQPLEAGLAPDWRVLDPVEEGDLRAEAVSRALTAAGPELDAEFLRDLHEGELRRSVHRALLEAVEASWEVWLDARPEAWDFPPPPPEPAVSRAELLAAVPAIPLPRTARGKPDRRWEKALVKLREALEAEDWPALLQKGLVAKVLQGEESYYGQPLQPELVAVAEGIQEHARHALLPRVRRRNRAIRRFLAHYAREHGHLLARARGLGFGDLARILERLQADDADLAFRRGAPIRHLLLDEFQDTSVRQWRVLAPFVTALRGQPDRAFFCVGDPKQSIFGWREGEPGLLRRLAREFPEERRQTNYRSAPLVLDTVDRVFRGLPAHASPPLQEVVAAWQADWRDHEAAPGNRELPGRAAVRVAPAPDDGEEDAAQLQVQAILELVARRRAEAPGAVIGVLLRRNRWIPRLLLGLQERGIPASGEGGNPLVDAAVVQALLSLLQLADHPGDEAAAFHVAVSFLGAEVELPRERQARRRRAPQVTAQVRRRLLTEGYAPFLASFQEAVTRHGDAWDRKRYARLLDLAAVWDAQGGGLRPAAFADWVRATPVEEPGRAAVRVLTVHRAKGLEYDAVILGDLDGHLFRRPPAVLALRDGIDGPVVQASVAGNAFLRSLSPEWQELHDRWRARQYEESLCLLYVALSRARRSLDAVLAHDAPQDTLGSILLAALGAERRPGETVWEHPDSTAAWARGLAAVPPAPPAGAASPLPPRIELAPPRGKRLLPRRAPSAGRGRVDPGHLFAGGGEAARERGLLVHRWLQEVAWLEDFRATDEELLARAAELELREVDPEALLPAFRRLLERPDVAAVLRRDLWPRAAGEEIQVEREREFLLHLEDAAGPYLARGAFDRLVVHLRDGRPAAAHVLDWKCEAGRPAELGRRYASQLAAYQAAAARILELPETAVQTRIVPVPLQP